MSLASCHPKSKTTVSRNKTPFNNPNPFINGPSLDKGEEAHTWAESMQKRPDGKQRNFRMPVFVDSTPKKNVLNPQRYYAGVESGASNKNILEIRLDDSRLGISLSERIDQYCPDPNNPCIIQIEATWGPLMEVVSAMHDPRPVLALYTVSKFTEDPSTGNSAFHISVEK